MQYSNRGQGKLNTNGMYTEKQLVSFGNFLLHRYGVMVHSTDGKNEPLYQRLVHHADHCNWLAQEGLTEEGVADVLPSAHQHGDYISFAFGDGAPEQIAEVIGVHFYRGKVKYDLAVSVEPNEVTRIYNVDSVWCKVRPAIATGGVLTNAA